ncbi:adenylate/guanylate cyclase domain-containing protein [uncultured Draconibacterium sp.]|uniref:adenylate/guanylate cyclase domain-containing protein n=1 Tax=uncultured Draconibacterium sp. TaxID=1573823 RepID=UPI0032612956
MKKRSLYIKKISSQAEKILWITLFWTIISALQFFSSYSTLIQLDLDISGLNPTAFLYGSLITGLTAGLIGGSSIVFFWSKWLRTKSYAWSLLSILCSYSLVYFVVALTTTMYFKATQLNIAFNHPDTWEAVWNSNSVLTVVQNYLFWLLIVIISLIGLLVNDKYGPGVFKSFILGKYFQPKREERIFMFLDIRGSTTIAEQLGEGKYFNFLKDVIRDVTPKILDSKGEIYQYVGDEIVISWKQNTGIENANCLQCFFDIKKTLLERAVYYRERYKGLTPEFKAGLHYGFVMVGEIGIVKREIAYSGDVLNTAARIQSKCNEMGVDILVSKFLLNKMGELPKQFASKAMGEIKLLGKQHALALYTV